MRNAPDYRYSMSPACRETRVLYRRYRRGPKRPRCRGHADGIFCIRGGYGYRRARANDVHYVPHLAVAQNPFDRSPPQPVYDHPDAPAWVAEVTLYRDTWFDKITKNHLEMLGKEDAVRLVVSSPTAVCIASSNPASEAQLRSDHMASHRQALDRLGTDDGRLRSVTDKPNIGAVLRETLWSWLSLSFGEG